MQLETILEKFPTNVILKKGLAIQLRPLESADEKSFHEFFLAVPERERMFIKHRVTDSAVIHDWCQHIDLGRNLPLLAVADQRIIGAATLHQQLGGWRRHIGRVSVLVHPDFRHCGLGRALVTEIVEVARHTGLERLEAEFLADQAVGLKLFGMLGFSQFVCLPHYVKDMQAMAHDYVLMALDLETDEEYAGVG